MQIIGINLFEEDKSIYYTNLCWKCIHRKIDYNKRCKFCYHRKYNQQPKLQCRDIEEQKNVH